MVVHQRIIHTQSHVRKLYYGYLVELGHYPMFIQMNLIHRLKVPYVSI